MTPPGAERSLAAAAVIAGLFLSASLFAGTVALRLTLLLAASIAAAVALASHRGMRALPPIWIAFALWAGWAVLSLAWSIDPGRTGRELRNEVGYTALALWACFIAGQARLAVRIVGPTVALAAAVVCAVAIREYQLGTMQYLEGLHGGPGDHSSALLVLAPCAAVAAWYGTRARWSTWARVAIWGLLALFVASAYTTLNRTIWVGFAVQAALLGSLMLLKRNTGAITTRTKLAVAAAALAACVAGAGMVLNTQAKRDATGMYVLPENPRIALWPEIIERIGERPLTGYGFGRGILQEPLQKKFKALDPNLWHAHNLLLEAVLQLGLPGLALLAWLIAGLLREGWRRAREPDDAAAAFGMALVGVVAGMVVRNMTDSLLGRQNALLFWGMAGILLALAQSRQAGNGQPARS